MAQSMDYSIRSVVELDEAVELPNLIQSPSPSQAIQDRLRKRQKLREKFKEVFDELKDEELGIVHKGVQVGRSQVRYKGSSTKPEAENGIYSLMTNTRAQQVAKEANQVESIFQRPSVRESSGPLPSKRNVRRIAPSDEDKLYEDTREDPTVQWTVPSDLYDDDVDGNKKKIDRRGYNNQKSHFSRLQFLLYNLRIGWRRYFTRNVDRIPFLQTQIKKIEGNFGVGIASFFVFCRFVITMNIILAVLWTAFVILPAAIKYDSSQIASYNVTKELEKDPFHVRNIFDGRGPVAHSWLFYGGYVRENFCESDSDCITHAGPCDYSSCSYRIDIAYMIMITLSLFGPFFILSWSYSESLSNSGNVTKENASVPFSVTVLTSWDHSLVSSEAAENLSKGITNTLKDKLTEYRNAEKKKIQTNKERVELILRRVIAWLIALLLIAVATASIVLNIIFGPAIREGTEGRHFIVQTIGEYLELYGTSVLFVIINALVPTLIFFLLPIEKYDSGKTEFNVTITRVFLVHVLNLYALMAGWKISTEGCDLEEDVVCAGTYYGQELYKVTLLSIAATIFGQLILRFGYFYWFNVKKEFLVADAVLAVVYIQSLVWTGTAVCPFLPLIAAVGLVCLFFAYYYIVQYTCHPPIKRWSQSRQNSFFLFSLLAALVFVIMPVSITVQTDHVPLGTLIFSNTEIGENKAIQCYENLYCGPFRNRTAIFAIFPDEESEGCGVFCELFFIFFSSAIGLPLLFCLIVALLHLSIRLTRAKKKHNSLLRELEMERQNSKILLKEYHRVQFELNKKIKHQEGGHGHYDIDIDIASLARGESRASF